MNAQALSVARAALGRELTRVSVGAIGIRAAGAAFGFLFNIVLARSLGREGTGTVMFYLNFGTMVGLVATAGMDVVGLRELSRLENDRLRAESVFAQILCNALISSSLFSVLGLAILLRFGASLAGAADAEICVASALILFLTSFQKSCSDWLIGIHEFAASQLVFFFINRVLSLALLVAALVLIGARAELFILIYAIGLFLAVLFGTTRIVAHFSWRRIMDKVAPSLPLFRDGVSCGIQNAAFIALNLSPFVLLGALSNTSQIGLFGVSQRLVALMVLTLTTVSQFAMRDFARASGQREFGTLARTLTVSVRLTFAAAVPLTVGLVAFAPLWISVFGRAFAGAEATLALLACAICAQCLGMPFQSALLATNHERSARDVTLVCAAVGVALNVFLIPRWGAEGAAIGTGVGLALQSLGHAIRVLSLLPVRLHLAGLRFVPAQIAEAES
ncbi:MAG TPA: polysaccharide biosynthesis C-terminal domain-containing protein [Rhizomicrobium sp.]|nr:polysaccharide biosynthesis C-terminal domain-containing protein [Rhizomicrobium sp.]